MANQRAPFWGRQEHWSHDGTVHLSTEFWLWRFLLIVSEKATGDPPVRLRLISHWGIWRGRFYLKSHGRLVDAFTRTRDRRPYIIKDTP